MKFENVTDLGLKIIWLSVTQKQLTLKDTLGIKWKKRLESKLHLGVNDFIDNQ